jgi:hypothetical protein
MHNVVLPAALAVVAALLVVWCLTLYTCRLRASELLLRAHSGSCQKLSSIRGSMFTLASFISQAFASAPGFAGVKGGLSHTELSTLHYMLSCTVGVSSHSCRVMNCYQLCSCRSRLSLRHVRRNMRRHTCWLMLISSVSLAWVKLPTMSP